MCVGGGEFSPMWLDGLRMLHSVQIPLRQILLSFIYKNGTWLQIKRNSNNSSTVVPFSKSGALFHCISFTYSVGVSIILAIPVFTSECIKLRLDTTRLVAETFNTCRLCSNYLLFYEWIKSASVFMICLFLYTDVIILNLLWCCYSFFHW